MKDGHPVICRLEPSAFEIVASHRIWQYRFIVVHFSKESGENGIIFEVERLALVDVQLFVVGLRLFVRRSISVWLVLAVIQRHSAIAAVLFLGCAGSRIACLAIACTPPFVPPLQFLLLLLLLIEEQRRINRRHNAWMLGWSLGKQRHYGLHQRISEVLQHYDRDYIPTDRFTALDFDCCIPSRISQDSPGLLMQVHRQRVSVRPR